MARVTPQKSSYINSSPNFHLNEIDEKIEIVFQNPIENELNIYSQKIITGITLIDLNGSIVKNFRGNSMDTSFISSGMYFIKILLDDGRIVTRKVIKK